LDDYAIDLKNDGFLDGIQANREYVCLEGILSVNDGNIGVVRWGECCDIYLFVGGYQSHTKASVVQNHEATLSKARIAVGIIDLGTKKRSYQVGINSGLHKGHC